MELSKTRLLNIVLFLFVTGFCILYFSGGLSFGSKKQILSKNESESIKDELNIKIQNYEKEISRNSTNSDKLLEFAHFLSDNGFYDKAIGMYNRYLKLNPDVADVIVDQGVCYYNLQDFLKAETNFLNALKIKPNHEVAHFNLDIIAMTTGQMDRAKAWWAKMIKINPESEYSKKTMEILNSHK